MYIYIIWSYVKLYYTILLYILLFILYCNTSCYMKKFYITLLCDMSCNILHYHVMFRIVLFFYDVADDVVMIMLCYLISPDPILSCISLPRMVYIHTYIYIHIYHFIFCYLALVYCI